MTPEELAQLREPFPPEEVGKLPRITCGKCREANGKVCQDHAKSKCQVCDNYITGAHMHLDYVGHAETTDRLLSVDPDWSWEPVAWTEDGTPAIARHGTNLVMWGRLTVHGMTRLGVGTAAANKDDAHKELIGDFLRNAAMRFGVALDLWRKSERVEAHAESAEHEAEQDGWYGWPDEATALTAHSFMADRISAGPEQVKTALREFRRQNDIGWPMSATRWETFVTLANSMLTQDPPGETRLPVSPGAPSPIPSHGDGDPAGAETAAPAAASVPADPSIEERRLQGRVDLLPETLRRSCEDELFEAGFMPQGVIACTAEQVKAVSKVLDRFEEDANGAPGLQARAASKVKGTAA